MVAVNRILGVALAAAMALPAGAAVVTAEPAWAGPTGSGQRIEVPDPTQWLLGGASASCESMGMGSAGEVFLCRGGGKMWLEIAP